jgi:hypothetical protein
MSGWKKEIRGQTEYKLAVDLLAALYRFRDATRGVENDIDEVKYVIEYNEDGGDYHPELDDYHSTIISQFRDKLKNIAIKQEDIYKYLVVGEAIFPKEITPLFNRLFTTVANLENPLAKAMQEDNPLHTPTLSPRPSAPFTADKDNLIDEDYDKIGTKIEELVAEIETLLKPKLKL